MKFYCPDCNQKLEAEADMVGTIITCPVCEVDFRVPFPGPRDAPAGGSEQSTANGRGTRVLTIGWTCFALGALMLVAAAAAALPLPSPLFLAASCALGAFAIHRQRKIPGYALVICGILLLPLSLVFVAQAFAVRARARFGDPAPRIERTAPSPEPAPGQPLPPQAPPGPETDAARTEPRANARRILKPVEPPPPGQEAAQEPVTRAPPAESAAGPPSPPERKLSAAEKKKIFALFMEADGRATREAAQAEDDPDAEPGKKGKMRLQQKLAAQYKREIEKRFSLTPRQSREILAEGIDAGLEEIPE